MIDVTKLVNLRQAWPDDAVLSHDFNTDGLQGWNGSLGIFHIGQVPENLTIEYHSLGNPGSSTSLDQALYMHTEQSAVVLERPLNIDPASIAGVRMATTALTTRLDGDGIVTLHAAPYYKASPQGAIVAWGPPEYNNIATTPVQGETWITAKATGKLEIHSPTGKLEVGKAAVYKVENNVYLVDGEPYRVEGGRLGVAAKQANGGLQTRTVEEIDGLTTAVTPGNPLLLRVNKTTSRGAILLDLAPGPTRLPTKLELYRMEDNRWIPVGEQTIIPAEGRIGFKISGEGIYMLKSTATTRIDRVTVASVKPLNQAELEEASIRGIKVEGGKAIIDYDPGRSEWILALVDASVSDDKVMYSGSPAMTIYGKLYITNPDGAPSVNGAEWITVWSDVVEIPGDASEAGLVLVGYKYNGEPDCPLLVGYVKTLLYPVVANAGYPTNSYDIALHTEAIVGIKLINIINVDPDLILHLEASYYRTSVVGDSYYGGPLDIPDVNITFGILYVDETQGCEPPNEGKIWSSILDLTIQSTNPSGSGAYAGIADALAVVSTLGNIEVLLATAAGIPATTIEAVSTATGVFAGIAELMFGFSYDEIIGGTKVNYMDCVYFHGRSIVTDYGWFDSYKHAVMSLIGDYYIDFPTDEYGVLMGAVVFNKYVHGDYYATDDDAIVIVLYFIKPVGS